MHKLPHLQGRLQGRSAFSSAPKASVRGGATAEASPARLAQEACSATHLAGQAAHAPSSDTQRSASTASLRADLQVLSQTRPNSLRGPAAGAQLALPACAAHACAHTHASPLLLHTGIKPRHSHQHHCSTPLCACSLTHFPSQHTLPTLFAHSERQEPPSRGWAPRVPARW